MDYLDPIKKQSKRKKLLIMYALMGVAIAIATLVMVYLVNGYSIGNDGAVIQNGLLYIDSRPESAEVFLNGEKQRGRTDARLVVPEGSYAVDLKRDGYRTWSRSMVLEGGSLRRLTYARLVPETLASEPLATLPSEPQMVSQSIDKRWLVMSFDASPLILQYIDLNRAVPQLERITLPVGTISTTTPGKWRAIDWADDNKTLLAVFETESTRDFVLIDREKPENSKNISKAFNTTAFTDVELRNRKKDQLYLYNEATAVLLTADINNGTTSLILDEVLAYVAFGDDAVLYITDDDKVDDLVEAYLVKDNDTYKLRSIKKDTKYLLDMSKLGSALVMGIGSPLENRVIVYNDPIDALKDNEISDIPVPTTVLRVASPQELVISADSSVIVARGAENFASHEFEADRSYTFKLNGAIDENQELRWLDGQHILLSIGGLQHIFDFDGSNNYTLVASTPFFGTYADNRIDYLVTLKPADATSAEVQLTRTFLRSVADR